MTGSTSLSDTLAVSRSQYGKDDPFWPWAITWDFCFLKHMVCDGTHYWRQLQGSKSLPFLLGWFLKFSGWDDNSRLQGVLKGPMVHTRTTIQPHHWNTPLPTSKLIKQFLAYVGEIALCVLSRGVSERQSSICMFVILIANRSWFLNHMRMMVENFAAIFQLTQTVPWYSNITIESTSGTSIFLLDFPAATLPLPWFLVSLHDSSLFASFCFKSGDQRC